MGAALEKELILGSVGVGMPSFMSGSLIMMKTLSAVAFAACLAGSAFNAQALLITPATVSLASGSQTSQAVIGAVINPLVGGSPVLFKKNVGGTESGSLAASYEATFINAEDGVIKYTGGSVVDAAYLLVKGGAGSPAWYLFDLSTKWNGVEDIVLNDFWVGPGSISHVSLYGKAAQFTPASTVADAGTTLALLGLGLGAIGVVRRKVA